MSTAAELAETFTEAAVLNYQRDGHLAPLLAMLTDERRVFVTLGPTDDVATTAARTLMAFCAVVQPDYVVLIAESWSRQFPEGELDVDLSNYEHGQLEREESAGDPTVATALMCHVLDTKSFEDSHLTLTTDHGDHLSLDLSVSGFGEGRIPYLLRAAYEDGLHVEPPTFDVHEIADFLGDLGWISSMMLEEA